MRNVDRNGTDLYTDNMSDNDFTINSAGYSSSKFKIACMIIIFLLVSAVLSTVITGIKAQSIEDNLYDSYDVLSELEQLSPQIEDVCTSLDSIGSVIDEKFHSDDMDVVVSVEAEIEQFQHCSNKMIDLIKEYENISNLDYGYMYESVNVNQNYDEAMAQKEEIVTAMEEYRELVLAAQTTTDPYERARLRATASVNSLSNNAEIFGFLPKYDSNVFSEDIEELISNKEINRIIKSTASQLEKIEALLITFSVLSIVLLCVLALVLLSRFIRQKRSMQ